MTTERWPSRYELFVGLRYILTRSGNRFISFISLISLFLFIATHYLPFAHPLSLPCSLSSL